MVLDIETYSKPYQTVKMERFAKKVKEAINYAGLMHTA